MNLIDQVASLGLADTAKELACRGLLYYQPFMLAEDLETGVGYEFETGRYAGLIYSPNIEPELLSRKELARLVVNPSLHDEFSEANSRLRVFYEFLADTVCDAVGGALGNTFLDVGANSGYLPAAFALRGAAQASGCDREPAFAEAFDFLSRLLGVKLHFHEAFFNPSSRTLALPGTYDVVSSMAVLCHVSDPLSFLASIARLAKKAVFVWTLVNEDPGRTLHFGPPRADYPEDAFPNCFDNLVCPSRELLRISFERLGFPRIQFIDAKAHGHPAYQWAGYPFQGVLALRGE